MLGSLDIPLHHVNHRIRSTNDSLIEMGHMFHELLDHIHHETIACAMIPDDEHGNDLYHIYNHTPIDSHTTV